MRLTPTLLSLTVGLAALTVCSSQILTQQAMAQSAPAPAASDNKSTVPATTPPAVTPPAASTDSGKGDSNATTTDKTDPNAVDPSAPDSSGGDDISLGDIPDVQTEELTPDLAKKAVDGYVMVHDKYQDSPLEDYQDLQEFVDKDPKGKQFETDIKGYGFATVNDWNIAVTSVSVAYNNILDDQTDDIKQQIEDLKKSTDMADDMKQKNIKSLEASIPSENNTKVIQDLMKDKDYVEKLKLLETTEE
jgi:hypothetical protein